MYIHKIVIRETGPPIPGAPLLSAHRCVCVFVCFVCVCICIYIYTNYIYIYIYIYIHIYINTSSSNQTDSGPYTWHDLAVGSQVCVRIYIC